ncbi:MAG: methyltransferase domain-containing protein [Planctomycetota bacterium]
MIGFLCLRHPARQKTRTNLRFILMDINHLDFTELQFGVVFSNATLHWVKDHRHLLQSVRRVLRPGGRLRFNFAGDGNCSAFFTVIREAMAQEEFRSFFVGFEWPWYMPRVDEYQSLAEASQLRDVRVWGENADRYFPDENAMIGWVDQPSLVPFLVHVADRAKEAFRSFVVFNVFVNIRYLYQHASRVAQPRSEAVGLGERSEQEALKKR